MAILFCGIICALISLLPLAATIRRVKKEGSAMAWTLLVLSILWAIISISGVLRIAGVLPTREDGLGMNELAAYANSFGKDFVGLALAVGIVGILLFNGYLWIFVRRITERNKVWWICGSLFAYLFAMFVIACLVGYGNDKLSIDTIFFGECCASLAVVGWALGLTYKEFCVIGNVYLEAGICLLSALWLAKVTLQWATERIATVRVCISAVAISYALLYVAAFIAIVCYYLPPLDAAFDKCYDDLNRWAKEYGSTYNRMNYLIFILGFLVPVLFNCLLGYILQMRHRSEETKVPLN